MDLHEAIVDDREQGVFRVKRNTMTRDDVWQLERERIFDTCWLYIGHDSEIDNPGDFVRRKVAGRPLVFVRGQDGTVRALINSCTHRGARVCRQDAGNAKAFQCFYHAWTFNTEGALVGIPDKDGYAPGVDPAQLGLRHVPRLDCYRDFWFVCFDPDAEPLGDYLASQGDDEGAKQLKTAQARAYDLGNGHAVVDYPAPFPRVIARWHPIFGEDAKPEIQAIRDELVERHGEERAYRMAETCRNLFIFPNLLLLDVAGLTIRTVNPVRPDYMELTAHALAAREEGPERLRRRLENFNLFLGPGGLATPDDVEALEACQEGFQATAEDYSDISRGMHRDAGTVDELQMRAFWREWQSNMLGAGHAVHDEGRKPAPVAS